MNRGGSTNWMYWTCRKLTLREGYLQKPALDELAIWDLFVERYVPKPRSFFGRKAAMKKSRSYPDEVGKYPSPSKEWDVLSLQQLESSIHL